MIVGQAMRTRRSVIRSVLVSVACTAVFISLVQAVTVEAAPIVLNCEISEGASETHGSIQIFIDEDEGVAIYNYHLLKKADCLQEFRVEDSLAGGAPKEATIDLCMRITINTDKFILANDASGAFVMTKHDGRFVKAFVTPVPLKDGNWLAFGNTHWGRCVKSPFD